MCITLMGLNKILLTSIRQAHTITPDIILYWMWLQKMRSKKFVHNLVSLYGMDRTPTECMCKVTAKHVSKVYFLSSGYM